MTKLSTRDKYLERYSVDRMWKMVSRETGPISQVVVIPAYAERDYLFQTLYALAKNTPSSLEYSFVLCVVNNGKNPPSDVLENNLQTIRCLDALIHRKALLDFSHDPALQGLLSMLADSRLKLGYIDAATAGREIPPATAGVGMARKIGMDMALRLLPEHPVQPALIISLDADSLVADNYLSAIRNDFSPEMKAAVVAYEHQMPEDSRQREAILCYEIFLRYWVLGLKYASSPWAFHSIGSTMVTTTQAYAEVRGMNKRAAGEDFYFLQKLAKLTAIHYIRKTRVYPSARSSERVPFGTGKSIRRFLGGDWERAYLLYDPRIFEIIKRWLELAQNNLFDEADTILNKARDIHPLLKVFLESQDFSRVWFRIRKNTKNPKTFLKQFNDWFDGFRTLKLVNFLTRTAYPRVNMVTALQGLLEALDATDFRLPVTSQVPRIEDQMVLLRYLREIT